MSARGVHLFRCRERELCRQVGTKARKKFVDAVRQTVNRIVILTVAAGSCLVFTPDSRSEEKKTSSQMTALAACAANQRYLPMDRVQALTKLGAMGEEARPVTHAICTAMLATSSRVREEANATLQKVFPALHPHVSTLLTDRDYLHHFEALHALTDMKGEAKGALPIVLHHLKVNADAVVRLGNINSELLETDFDLNLAIPIIEELVKADKNGRMKVLTEEAKREQALLTPAGQAGLLAAADCIVAARIAGDNPNAAQAVAKAVLKHPNNLVRFAGVAGLHLFGRSARSALPALKKATTADPDKSVRELAAKIVQKTEESRK